MSNPFIPIDRDPPVVIPVQEWLGEDHLARFIVAVVESLEVTALKAAYGGGGSAPYPPKMMLALLFYGYATGLFSSRALERATYELIPVIYITGTTHPDHNSINTFRQRFLGYNAQAGVDHGSRLIVENPVSQNPNDKQERQPALANLNPLPPRLGQVEHLLADNSYCSEANVTACEQATLTPLLATGRATHHPPWKNALRSPAKPLIRPIRSHEWNTACGLQKGRRSMLNASPPSNLFLASSST